MTPRPAIPGAADQPLAPELTLDAAANVLGALALAIHDQSVDTIAAATDQPVTAATALSAMHQFLGAPTLDSLHRVLGLTPSGAVRLVDRLEADGLVTRGPGRDGRSRAVALTAAGARAAEEVARARTSLLRRSLQDLDTHDLATLKRLLDAVLSGVVRAKFEAGTAGRRWTCRLCDLAACRRAEGHCPAANTARAITTPPPPPQTPEPTQR